jgi:hypothetical protein
MQSRVETKRKHYYKGIATPCKLEINGVSDSL